MASKIKIASTTAPIGPGSAKFPALKRRMKYMVTGVVSMKKKTQMRTTVMVTCLSAASWNRQNGRHFADNIFKYIFLNENIWIPIKISLKFVPKGLINNIPALVQIMAWRRLGDKPLFEPVLTQFTDAYMRH